MSTPVRLAYFVSHPIQYQAPLLRYIVRNSDIDLTALFMNDHSLREYRDVGFGAAVKWDVPLIEGYKSELIPALGGRDSVEGLKPYNFGILQALKRGGYDAIWLHGYAHPSNLRAIWAAKFLGMKVLVRGEPNLLVARRSAGTAGLKDKAVQWLFRQIDGFLAIGSMNREYYLHHGVPEEKIFMVPYTVDNEFFQAKAEEAAPNRESLRAELGLAPGRPVVLYASKFTARKKADVLLEAYRSPLLTWFSSETASWLQRSRRVPPSWAGTRSGSWASRTRPNFQRSSTFATSSSWLRQRSRTG
jgi:glycosyltransferase involved in cell wall biosynthesis